LYPSCWGAKNEQATNIIAFSKKEYKYDLTGKSGKHKLF